MSQLPPTYYVIEPRDEPCYIVNPLLWVEFCKRYGRTIKNCNFFTEAHCIQWLDSYYEKIGLYKETQGNELPC